MHSSSDHVLLKVDGVELSVPNSFTVMQACEAAGAVIPRFCYHERLSVAGNCRMCLIEVVGTSKPIASCAYSVADLRPPPGGTCAEISTKSDRVKNARNGVLGFILANHPLDCPICDQGGECDLQDQAMVFGADRSHFIENKRAVEDKYIGPLVKTSMNRCIHCTRCVRFITEVAGVGDLGATGRGEDMEITTYLESAMSSELQGNVIDLCPVGALTSRPYAFTARPWELSVTHSIDVHDAAGSAIQIDSRNNEVMRIRPGINPAINEEWLADRSRFVWDGLKHKRLDRPWSFSSRGLQPAPWPVALDAVASALKPGSSGVKPRILVVAGPLAALEELIAIRDLLGTGENVRYESRVDGNGLHPSIASRAGYTLGSSIPEIEHADSILLVGTNPRLESPIINLRIRKAWQDNNCSIGYIGPASDVETLNYPVTYLGDKPGALPEISQSQWKTALSAQCPMIILGSGALQGTEAGPVIAAATRTLMQFNALRDDWNGLSILPTSAAQTGALDIGFVPDSPDVTFADSMTEVAEGKFDVVWLVGADPEDLHLPERSTGPKPKDKKRPMVIYQGSHGDRCAKHADVILPGAAYTEKSGTYVNAEGKPQRTTRAVFSPGEAREDWAIVRALSAVMRQPLPYDSCEALQDRMEEQWPYLGQTDTLSEVGDTASAVKQLRESASTIDTLPSSTAVSIISDPYQTNQIMRASAVMRDVSDRWSGQKSNTQTNIDIDAVIKMRCDRDAVSDGISNASREGTSVHTKRTAEA